MVLLRVSILRVIRHGRSVITPQSVDSDQNGQREICDHWRKPIQYTHWRHFPPGEEIPPGRRFLLLSAGPDGEFEDGHGDDITNWK